jgi:hypothetical protein
MYYRARKLDDHLFTGMRDTSQTDQLLALQVDAYIVAIGALSMLDSKDAWISCCKCWQGRDQRKAGSGYLPA